MPQIVTGQHHTADEVEALAEQARDIAARIFRDDEDRRAVLPTLLHLLGAKTVTVLPDAPAAMLPGLSASGNLR